jgi:hypothetical protein
MFGKKKNILFGQGLTISTIISANGVVIGSQKLVLYNTSGFATSIQYKTKSKDPRPYFKDVLIGGYADLGFRFSILKKYHALGGLRMCFEENDLGTFGIAPSLYLGVGF